MQVEALDNSNSASNINGNDDDAHAIIAINTTPTINIIAADTISVSSAGTDRASNHHRNSNSINSDNDGTNDKDEELQLLVQPTLAMAGEIVLPSPPVPATVATTPHLQYPMATMTMTTANVASSTMNNFSNNICEDVSSLGSVFAEDDVDEVVDAVLASAGQNNDANLLDDNDNIMGGDDQKKENEDEERTLSEIRTLSEMALSVHNNNNNGGGGGGADTIALASTAEAASSISAATSSSSSQQQQQNIVSTPKRPSFETAGPSIPLPPSTPLSSPRGGGGGGGGSSSNSRLNSSSNNSSSFNTPITSPPSPTPSTPASFVRLTSGSSSHSKHAAGNSSNFHHNKSNSNGNNSPYNHRPGSTMMWSVASPFKSIIVDNNKAGGGGTAINATNNTNNAAATSTTLARQLSTSSTTPSCSPIRLGICAMDKKARSKPMKEILHRLDPTLFEPVYFGDEMILNMPVESWPIVDVLIAFYSNGYPLEKAEDYVSLRRPYLLNCLATQRTLMDRRRVYDLLEECGIDVPRHVFVSRDGYVSTGTGDGKPIPSTSQRPSMRPGGVDAALNAAASSAAFAPSGVTTCDAPSSIGTSTNTASIINNTVSTALSSTLYGANKKNSPNPEYVEPIVDEHDDHIEVNGVTIHKPFVEKPVDADDHNIAIYYPSSAGGGCKKLFRKVGDRSSEFYPEINEIRRDGSYIYEEFMETQGVDVKMYTVGPDYGHAEARKSPAVDGKVERNADGKEVRFPVILTLREKEIARRIVLVFKQQVCGFDILRIQEGDSLVSYVIDVNGWSFVKNSRKYYDDCAQILTEHMLAACKSASRVSFSALAPLLATMEDPVESYSGWKAKKSKHKKHNRGPSIADRVKKMLLGDGEENDDGVKAEEDDKVSELGDPYEESEDFTTNPIRNLPDQLANEPASSSSVAPSGNSSLADVDEFSLNGKENGVAVVPTTHQEELRCVITIIRHGDRTPKQKLKGDINGEHFLRYFHDHQPKVKKDLKVKAKKDMVEFLETVKDVIRDMEAKGDKKNRDALYKARHIRDVLQRWKFSGLNRKLQMKPRKWIQEETPDGNNITKCSEMQLIVKWGGDLTKLGEKQAVQLGNRLRNELYPSNRDGGILRLHSTFRHDLKIKTSDEGRVMKTAAAFAKGMLELEGDIPPILVSLVHKEKDSRHMLDPSGNKEVEKDLDKCKEMINIRMQRDVDYDKLTKEEREILVGPDRLTSLHKALKKIGNPRKTLIAIHSTIGQLVEQLDDMLGELLSGDEEVIEGGEGLKGKEGYDEALSGIKLYKGETLLELTERWKLLQNKLYNEEKDMFDLSRVPDVHDNVRFDMLHNPHLGLTETLQKLYDLAKAMADCVVPQEYGITIEEKRDIGAKMCHTLLEKINYDLTIARTDNQVDMRYLINMDYSADLPINSMGRRVRSRLYFTSESHLHSLLNVLRFPSIAPSPLSLKGQGIVASASELCYLTQVVIRLFEDNQKPADSAKRFRVEILFSPGATATPLHMAELNREQDPSRFETEKLQKISIEGLTCAQVEEYFAEAIKEGKINDKDDEDSVVAPVLKREKSEGTKPNRTNMDSFIERDQVKCNNSKVNCADLGKSALKSIPSTIIEEACNDQACNDHPQHCHEEDLKSLIDVNADNNNFWRSATAVGLFLGAGCLYMMSRASKSMLK